MKTRKLVLIIADLALLAIVIVQGILLSRDGSKIFRLKETPDEIIITQGTENVVLKFENNEWVLGDEKFATNQAAVDSILDSIESIRCLEKVTSVTKQGALEKYELGEDQKITVTANREGKTLRELEIGKNASTGSQNFITVDGGKDIYLATGGLGYSFDVTEDDVRTNVVWNFNQADINAVEVISQNGKSFTVSKNGSGADLEWSIYGAGVDGIELDNGKAQSWFDSLGNITTEKWYSKEDLATLGGEKISTTRITHGFETVSIDIYKIPAATEDSIPTYYGKSTATPYPFELTSYTMEKINKNPEELAK